MPEERDMSGREVTNSCVDKAAPGSAAIPVAEVETAGEATPDPGLQTGDRLRSFLELGLVLVIAFGTSIFGSILPLFGSADHPPVSASTYFLLHRGIRLGGALGLLVYVIMSSPSSQGRRFTRDRLIGLGFAVALACWEPGWEAANWALATIHAPAMLTRQMRSLYHCLYMALVLFLVRYLLRRRGRSYAGTGLYWNSTGAALAAPLFLAGIALHRLESPIILWFGHALSGPGWAPPDISKLLFGGDIEFTTVVDNLLNGFYEELIVRAFVITMMIRLFRRPWLAICVSVAVQISYHFYQGVPLALSHIPLFTLYSLFYVRTRLILPIALAHSLVDLHSLWHYAVHPESGF
jgi:membrane protease YdiL (CAAX protease family)